jgi:hypothetical protein
MFSLERIKYSEPAMNGQQQQQQHQKEQKFFCDLAAALADGKLTPEKACSMIGELRDIKIFADDILEPKNREEEKQKGFNEIAGVYADYKITTEEACEVFVEWIEEWKHL